MDKLRVTNDWIKELNPDEIFIFGSKRGGLHGVGAA